MKNLKVKIIVGFREEQRYTIDGDEAHKAYYLFLHPEERGIFNNGIAIIGSSIRGIEPDYQSTMGWNISHELDSDDWNEIRSKGIENKLRDLLFLAKTIAQTGPQEKMSLPLSYLQEISENKNDRIGNGGMKSIGDILPKT
jgi:hypothetical protein